ncbi:hypothetical protein [Marinoscillum furvescens]|uniref:Uncharacterized protein n=1 Tax=Marinoscillum furvescens DSM 4134 TaxID=1122208 RepID=A0A3D9KWY1_MARFU|nr:hypothetical protein [Marinoscillum furvescens]RED92657.1 hypothetical protein C7460_12944 [Marinoscillum furvescens DSM 4134]
MLNLFKKKKKFAANCALSGMPLDRSTVFLIGAADLLRSQKFWNNVMAEPETLSYTEAYFKSKDATAQRIREMLLQKYVGEDKPWVIGDSYIHFFDVDTVLAQQWGQEWWDSEGKQVPQALTKSLSQMPADELDSCRKYVLEEAGRQAIAV